MRVFTRSVHNSGSVAAGVSNTITFPDVPGRILGLALKVTTTVSNTGAAAGTYTIRDVFRVLDSLTLQDRSGRSEFSGRNLEDLAVLAEALGHPFLFESDGGDLSDCKAVTIAATATHNITIRGIWPYVDRRKPSSQRLDFVRDDEVLGQFQYSVAQSFGSAATIRTGNVTFVLGVIWSPDAIGHAGLRREVLGQSQSALSYILDSGGSYRVLDVIALAPYVAGAAPDLSGFGTLTLREAGEPRMTSEAVADADVQTRDLMFAAPVNDVNLLDTLVLSIFGPAVGYSTADGLRGELNLDWGAAPSPHKIIYVRGWSLDHQEVLVRYPHLSAVPPARLMEIAHPVVRPGGQPASAETQRFTPLRLQAAAVIKAGGAGSLRNLAVQKIAAPGR